MRDFKKLQIWELGHKLTLDVYAITFKFPREEMFGLTSQLRRASRQSQQILPKVVAETVMLILHILFKSE